MINAVETNQDLLSMIKNQQAILEDLEKQVQQKNTECQSNIISINSAPNGYLSYFDAYCSLVKRLYLSDKLIQPIKPSQQTRLFEIFSIDTLSSLLLELIEDENERNVFLDFAESMGLIIFKDEDKKVLVTENGRRVAGARIPKDKFKKVLAIQGLVNEQA